MHKPLSPITQNDSTSKVDTFQSADIIRLYREQYGIDVNKYFPQASFDLFACGDTGYRFYHPEGMDGDGQFYADLKNSLGAGYYHEWNFQNQFAFEAIKKGDKILDIGCGEGRFIERVKAITSEVSGLELNETAVSTARSKGLNVSSTSIQQHAIDHAGHYDMVTMFQVLEHIYDVNDFIKSSLKVLKPGGLLVIGVPNSEPWFNSYDKYSTLNLPPHHMGLWNIKVFKKFADVFDLKLEKFMYDQKGRFIAEAYLRAKTLADVKSHAGKHSLSEKIKLMAFGLIAVPLTIIKKLRFGLNGSHIVVMFRKK